MKQELVRDWMSKDVITISPETTLLDAKQLMITYMIRRLPVMVDDQLVGIITYGDIRNAGLSRTDITSKTELGKLTAQLRVAEFMTRNPIAILQNATIGEAAQLMLNNMISGLTVLNPEGELVGIITESDIFRMVVRDWMKQETKVGQSR